MPVSNINKNEAVSYCLQDDLATVSCYAAGEIDNLILGRPARFEAVRRLLSMLQSSLICHGSSQSPQSLIDPTTAVAMGRALVHAEPDLRTSLRTVKELIEQSTQVAGLLKEVIENSVIIRQNKQPELKKLRSLCLALSSSVLACEESIEDQNQLQSF